MLGNFQTDSINFILIIFVVHFYPKIIQLLNYTFSDPLKIQYTFLDLNLITFLELRLFYHVDQYEAINKTYKMNEGQTSFNYATH